MYCTVLYCTPAAATREGVACEPCPCHRPFPCMWCVVCCALRVAQMGAEPCYATRPCLACSELPLRSCAHAYLAAPHLLAGRAPRCTKFSSACGLGGICTSAGPACLRPSLPVRNRFLRCAAAHAFRARVHGHITPEVPQPPCAEGIGGTLPTYPCHAPSLLLTSLHGVQLPVAYPNGSLRQSPSRRLRAAGTAHHSLEGFCCSLVWHGSPRACAST
jgi:hypothetical protein